MRARTFTGVVLGAALVATAACSTSTSGGGHGSGAPSSAASATRSTASGGLTQQQAQSALLAASDIGSDFVANDHSSTQSSPLPCEPAKPPLDQRYAPTTKAEADFALPSGKAEVDEEIVVYADEATAARALSAGEQGLSCHTATLGSGGNAIRVSIGGPKDVSGQLGPGVKVDKCEGWLVTATGISAVLVVARIGPQLVVLSFTADTSVDTSTLPNSQDVIKKAIQKVDAVA
jgi:hypothetical protein